MRDHHRQADVACGVGCLVSGSAGTASLQPWTKKEGLLIRAGAGAHRSGELLRFAAPFDLDHSGIGALDERIDVRRRRSTLPDISADR